MTQGFVLSVLNQSLYQILVLLLPLLGTAMIVGLIISIIQATTSIQEQTLTFVPKMIAVLVLLVFMAPFACSSLMDFTRRLLDVIATAHM